MNSLRTLEKLVIGGMFYFLLVAPLSLLAFLWLRLDFGEIIGYLVIFTVNLLYGILMYSWVRGDS